jgi:hypothetical protein
MRDVPLTVVGFAAFEGAGYQSQIAGDLPSIAKAMHVAQLQQVRHRRDRSDAFDLGHPLDLLAVRILLSKSLDLSVEVRQLLDEKVQLPH